MKYVVSRILLWPLDNEPLPEFVLVSAEAGGHKLAAGRVSTQFRDEHGRIIALAFHHPVVVDTPEQLVAKVEDPYLAERLRVEIVGEYVALDDDGKS